MKRAANEVDYEVVSQLRYGPEFDPRSVYMFSGSGCKYMFHGLLDAKEIVERSYECESISLVTILE